MGRGQSNQPFLASVSRSAGILSQPVISLPEDENVKIIARYKRELAEMRELRSALALVRLEAQLSFGRDVDFCYIQCDAETQELNQEIKRITSVLAKLEAVRPRLLELNA